MATVEIISQGDEVISGQIVDSNAAWLAEQLMLMGFTVTRHTTVGDHRLDIQQVLAESSQRADVVLCTGGLGPTQDDLTVEAVAHLTGQALVFDQHAMNRMQAMFARWGRPMATVNEKQAWLPEKAQRIDNHWGTAPGFSVPYQQALMIFLPGVPGEMKAMFTQGVKAELLARFTLQPGRLVTFRTIGVGESNLQQRIGPYHQSNVTLSYRAMGREVQIKLRFAAGCSQQDLERHCFAMKTLLGDDVFAIEGWGTQRTGGLGEVVATHLHRRGMTLVVAESSSGGRLTQLLKTPALENSPLRAGYYFDSQTCLATLLALPEPASQSYESLAETIRQRWEADLVVITSPFVAQPIDHGSAPAYKSTCYLLGADVSVNQAQQVTGGVEHCQHAMAYSSLDMLRRHLLLSGE